MDNQNLLSCPWCGKKPKVMEYQGFRESTIYRIEHDCPKFLNTMKMHSCATKSNAIEIWNLQKSLSQKEN